MLPKLLLMSLAICLLNSCESGPKLKICVSDVAAGGLDCYDEKSGKTSFLPYAQSEKYVCLNPTDANTLISYCSQ